MSITSLHVLRSREDRRVHLTVTCGDKWEEDQHTPNMTWLGQLQASWITLLSHPPHTHVTSVQTIYLCHPLMLSVCHWVWMRLKSQLSRCKTTSDIVTGGKWQMLLPDVQRVWRWYEGTDSKYTHGHTLHSHYLRLPPLLVFFVLTALYTTSVEVLK